MNKKITLCLLCLMSSSSLFGHEGHNGMMDTHTLQDWMQWIGNFHLILLHFPIALIVMTVIAECLYWKYKNPFFDHASRFMLIAAAVSTIPTAMTGLAFSYGVSYAGNMADIFWWHRFLGLFIAMMSFLTVILKELSVRKILKSRVYYFIFLLILFISISVTGYLGGEMTFEQQNLLPPIFQ